MPTHRLTGKEITTAELLAYMKVVSIWVYMATNVCKGANHLVAAEHGFICDYANLPINLAYDTADAKWGRIS